MERVKTRNSIKFAIDMIEDIKSTIIPTNLLKLLDCKSKSEQVATLKQIRITKDEFQAFCFTAFEKYDFMYSFYKFQHLRNDIDEKSLPKFAYLEEDGSVTKIGNTSLSDGKIKQILENRRVTFARVLEKGEEWHCFFYTFASLNGKEKSSVKHMHYVSNKWNFTIEQLIQKLREKTYSFGSTPHIEYFD